MILGHKLICYTIKKLPVYEDNPVNLMAGSKPDGVAYYRKRFAVTENARLNKRVILHFEGVSRIADIC